MRLFTNSKSFCSTVAYGPKSICIPDWWLMHVDYEFVKLADDHVLEVEQHIGILDNNSDKQDDDSRTN